MQRIAVLLKRISNNMPLEDCSVQIANSQSNKPIDASILESIRVLFTYYQFQTAYVFDHFVPNIKTLLPPRNYGARYHQNATFIRDPFVNTSLCFGISIFHVMPPESWTSSQSTSEQIAGFKQRFNIFIRDRSPNPPTIHSEPNGGWVESLTDGGSIALHCRQEKKRIWAIVVRSGLDHSLLNDIGKYMETLEMNKKPVMEFCHFMKRMEIIAEANRKRLAWMVCHIMDLQPLTMRGDSAPITTCLHYVTEQRKNSRTKNAKQLQQAIRPQRIA